MFQSDKFSIRCVGGLVLSITLLTSPVYGESAPSNKANAVEVSAQEQQAASQLSKLLNPLHYIKAGFAQHTLEASGKRIQESEGVMTVQRPNLFRWEVKKPFPQVVVSNGQKVWLYDMDLEQVTIQKLDARTNTTPALILSGETADLTRSFRVTESVSDGVSLFTLIPKGQDALFENLQLMFQGKMLSEMMLTDALGAKTRIEFRNLSSSTKRKLAEKDFELYIPPGVDVIDDES